MEEKKVQFKHLRVRKEHHHKVKMIAAELGITIDQAMQLLLDSYKG